ncbi:MAG TPA: MFS transporter [Micropepsaceae bacterium]|nr:MFS transporter [Micropepsaceae bacterium]
MSEIAAAPIFRDEADRAGIKRLMLFFALVYLTEGIGQSDGLIAQPLNYYLKQVYQWTPVQITAFLTVLNLPWFLKPLYGMVSDFVPLFGYRRKPYLLLANAVAAAAYFSIAAAATPGVLIFLLLLTAYGMAIASTLCGAVLVENGQKFNASSTFINQQWLWFNVATILTSLLGGAFVQWLLPITAVHAAAAAAGVAPILVMFGTLALIEEEKSAISLSGLKESIASLFAALKERRLWVIACFLFFFYFSPGIDTPLYFYMTDHLKFSQAYIGVLNAIGAAGWITAALAYGLFLQHLTAKTLLNLAILVGTLATLTYLLMSGAATAAFAFFCYGGASMMTLVATLGLAADHCPKRVEGFAFAAMMSVTNLSGAAADNVGSYLYEHVFKNEIAPLIMVAAAFTALNFVLVPLLKLGNEAPHAVLLRK